MPDMTEGQLLAQWRRSGHDGDFQMHLARRRVIIAFHKINRPWAVPVLDWLSRKLDRS